MGDWCNVAFVRASVADVAGGVASLLADDRHALIAAPAPRKPLRFDPMQYGDGASSVRWGVAIFPGARDWTVVKTAPFELLCEHPKSGGLPRLASLARALKTEAFQLNLYDGDSIVLLEADPAGRIRASGGSSVEDDWTRWQDLKLASDSAAFSILTKVPKEAREGIRLRGASAAVEAVRAALGGSNAAATDNHVNVQVLVRHAPLAIPGGRVLYFERQPSRDPKLKPREPLPIAVHESTVPPARVRSELAPQVASWPPHRRLHLTLGHGEAWVEQNRLRAPDAERGAAFLVELARWLGVELPAAAVGPVLLDECRIQVQPDGPTLLLTLEGRERAGLRLRLPEGGRGPGALEEIDPELRQRLVELLAPVLRDGVAPVGQRQHPLIERWWRFADEPGSWATRPAFVGESLVATEWQEDGAAVVLASDAPGAAPRRVARFDGLVTALVARPRSTSVAVCVAHPKGLPMVSGGEPASLLLLDLVTGRTQTLVDGGIDATKRIFWSPAGDELAFHSPGEFDRARQILEYGRVAVVNLSRPGQVHHTDRGFTARAWDGEGLLLEAGPAMFNHAAPPTPRVPIRWLRFKDSSLRPAEPTYLSPDGRFRITQSGPSLTVRGPAGSKPVVRNGVTALEPREGPIWLGSSGLLLGGKEPAVLWLEDGTIESLAPPSRGFSASAASASGHLVAAIHHGTALHWGVMSATSSPGKAGRPSGSAPPRRR